MEIKYSFIIPVYNRPDEVEELLVSMTTLQFTKPFEIVIIEDGSTLSSENIIAKFSDRLNISYYKKENSGPGDSRNYGMQKAKGNYFLILDSDCILPENYLSEADKSLSENYVDCFGGPDAAHESFSDIQKAINYVMTSFYTTGGIRGGKQQVDKFQPRSFNMGLSRKAFVATGGFGKIHPGEDPDLTIRLWKKGYKTKLISEAFVYHKRRISWSKFHTQVQKFGKCRPILNSWHPETKKITYWFPTLFVVGVIFTVVTLLLSHYFFVALMGIYVSLIFVDSTIKNKSFKIGALSVFALFIQFFGYGLGFLESTIKVGVLKQKPQEAFPYLFFK
ncbi:MAG: glycosyltransferase [Flavobacteriaceae bacterium]|nr:glycosyltransferase [Flavobacteriaceae bacterium]